MYAATSGPHVSGYQWPTCKRLPVAHVSPVVEYFSSFPASFTDAPPFELFGLDKQPALLLGTDLLKSFRRLSLDFRNRKVRFVLRH